MLVHCGLGGKCLLMEAARQIQTCQAQLPLKVPFDVTILCATNLLLEAKRAANRRTIYVKSLSNYLARFYAGRENSPLKNFTEREVEDWLQKISSPSSRQTWLNRISTLFSFAVRRGFIAVNPCDKIERVTVDRLPPAILTVAQSRQLLAATPTVCKPFFILATFAGIRPDEVVRLDWSQINLPTRTVTIDFGKTRRRRIVPLENFAVTELGKHPLQHGRVTPSKSTLKRWRKSMRAILGGKWHQDVLRHTAASYLYEKHSDAAKVAKWLGNSQKILMDHYVVPVTAADCAAFWNCDEPAELVSSSA